jgi:D-ribose pyranose/furanose isomerase RbsD
VGVGPQQAAVLNQGLGRVLSDLQVVAEVAVKSAVFPVGKFFDVKRQDIMLDFIFNFGPESA